MRRILQDSSESPPRLAQACRLCLRRHEPDQIPEDVPFWYQQERQLPQARGRLVQDRMPTDTLTLGLMSRVKIGNLQTIRAITGILEQDGNQATVFMRWIEVVISRVKSMGMVVVNTYSVIFRERGDRARNEVSLIPWRTMP